jgi:hypothetical protein
MMMQEAGIATLAGSGVRVLTSRGDNLTDSDDEMRVAMYDDLALTHSCAIGAGLTHSWDQTCVNRRACPADGSCLA